MKLVAYLNDPNIKSNFIERIKAHSDAGEIKQGLNWENGKGSAFGCTFHTDDPMAAENEAGWPVMLARFEDRIFEGLPKYKAMNWPLDFASTINFGQDLSLVGWQFLHWLQLENLKFAIETKMVGVVVDAIEKCTDILLPIAKGKSVDECMAAQATSAAWSLALIAAESTDRSALRAAESAARAALIAGQCDTKKSALSAEMCAVWVAESASRGQAKNEGGITECSSRRSATSTAWFAAYERMAESLINLIVAAPYHQ